MILVEIQQEDGPISKKHGSEKLMVEAEHESTYSETSSVASSLVAPTPYHVKYQRVLSQQLASGRMSRPTYNRVQRVLALYKGDTFMVELPSRSGILYKRGFGGLRRWVPRWFRLDDLHLRYYKDAAWPGGEIRGKLKLTHDMEVVDQGGLEFCIMSEGINSWRMRAADEEEKKLWMKKLTACIDVLWYKANMKVIRVLGRGAFGVVREIVNPLTNDRYAVKEIDVHNIKNLHVAEHEIAVLHKLSVEVDHPNVVNIYRVAKSRTTISIIMQFLGGGELYDTILKRRRFTEHDAAGVIKQLMSALHALHAVGILHLDIKPENLVYASKEPGAPVVLTDFGLSRILASTQKEQGTSITGTVGYAAPEVIRSKTYSPAADVFSAGVLLFVMLGGYPPFRQTRDDRVTLRRTMEGRYTMPRKYWGHVSKDARHLVRRMLDVKPSTRITVDEVLQHPWLQGNAPDTVLGEDTHKRLRRYNTQRKTTKLLTTLDKHNKAAVGVGGGGGGGGGVRARRGRGGRLSTPTMQLGSF